MTGPSGVPDFGERLARFKSATFKRLRPGQQQVLAAYAVDYLVTPDVAIEMPTGEGKTLLALLIADYALDQGMSVAYLTGTRQLAERVEDEAAKLGLEVARFAAKDYGGAKLDDYHQAQAVGVMNYWAYFNAKPVPRPADLVIFDDAHLAEQSLSGIQTLRIPDQVGPARDLYRTICDLVVAHTEAYAGLQAMRDGIAQPGTPPELLSFSDWAAIAAASREAIEASPLVTQGSPVDEVKDVKKLQDELKWVWPTVRDHLTRCGVLIGPSGIEIRPYHSPTTLNDWYKRARQRLYLSATLGSMDDLQRRIGGGPVTRLVTGQPLPPGTTGQRMLALNPLTAQTLDRDVVDWALEQVRAAGGKAAWLCASHSEADTLQAILSQIGHPIFRLRAGDDTAVESWSRAPGGQLITAGRYDGLDFPGDMCRLVIITTVPQASTEFERFVVAYLGDATFMRHRVGQRITQALGRANRTATDHSLYLGLDPTFAQILADPTVRASISGDTAPIVRAALELYDRGPDATADACRAWWRTIQSPSTPASVERAAPVRRPRPGRSASSNSETASADAEVVAATDLWIGDHEGAARKAREAADLLTAGAETEHAAFWHYVQAHALFDRGRNQDLADARAVLEDVTANGPRTAWFRRLSRTVADLNGYDHTADNTDRLFLAWDEWDRETGNRLGHALSVGRTLLVGSHDQQCDGLTMLARLVGASGERPSKTEQSATDCRWTWSTARRGQRRVWEVKTGTPHPVSRQDINQLLGQIEVETRHTPKTRVYGCLLTPATTLQDSAVEASYDRVTLLNHDAVVRLYDLLSDRLQLYVKLCSDRSAKARGEARAQIEAALPSDGWLEKLLSPSQGKIIVADDVVTLFRSH